MDNTRKYSIDLFNETSPYKLFYSLYKSECSLIFLIYLEFYSKENDILKT